MTLRYRTQRFTHRQLLVAFSGGLGLIPTVLLHRLVLLRELDPLTLRAIHVHHGLSPHADDWVAHCENVCQQWQVPLVVERVTLPKKDWALRPRRVKAAIRHLPAHCAGEVLVTAQHRDDQCETFLLALSGQRTGRAFSHGAILCLCRNVTVRCSMKPANHYAWARAHRLSWIEDESNQDDGYRSVTFCACA